LKTYKIEREVLNGFQGDVQMSINAITENVFNISDFTIQIDSHKFQYLLKSKTGSLKRLGSAGMSIPELESSIKSRIDSNYVYNLTYLPEFETIKFNIMIQYLRQDTGLPIRLTVALEYKAKEKLLRVITLF
jgi:hypothetical protein